ncbi:DsrE family protein [Sulfoacidibacillus ferrooxidans]|uniref:DsrE family protein n=1 Tax=Sulfoacidibacillus ferrooxidans TaxID=2005001 RepID=A0A9X1VA92_9BACL|nr:DsrE family protein [Sulfoacidibacillus ferrooxidans]MCI0183043.1 hypothetical protein [Sulfoacidibacillus ferrooxidans]
MGNTTNSKGKMGIMIVSKDEQRVKVALSLALHIQEAPEQDGVSHLEVYLFAEATDLIDHASDEIKQMISELISRGVMVGACKNLVDAYHVHEKAIALNLQVSGANATLGRWANEHYVTLSF